MAEEKVVEASELGLAPGVWPVVLNWQGTRYIQDHKRYTKTPQGRGEELASVEYRNLQGDKLLVVLND